MYRSKLKNHENESVMRKLAENFLSSNPKKKIFGNFRIEGDRLVYRTKITEEVSGSFKDTRTLKTVLDKIKSGEYQFYSGSYQKDLDVIRKEALNGEWVRFQYQYDAEELIALKISSDLVIGNSSVLPLVGRYSAIQRILAEKIPMIPFVLFDQAELEIPALNKTVKVGQMLTRQEFDSINRRAKELSERIDVLDPYYDALELDQVDQELDHLIAILSSSMFQHRKRELRLRVIQGGAA